MELDSDTILRMTITVEAETLGTHVVSASIPIGNCGSEEQMEAFAVQFIDSDPGLQGRPLTHWIVKSPKGVTLFERSIPPHDEDIVDRPKPND